MGEPQVCQLCCAPPSGVKNADESELKAIASASEDTHVYNVGDFNLMADIVDVLTRSVCERMEVLHKQITGPSSGHAAWP